MCIRDSSSYIARTELQADLVARLLDPTVRIVTLTGPGGAGKSRLAMVASSEVAAHFPHGVVYIPLATIFNSALVAPAISNALLVQEAAGQDLAHLIASALSGTRRLIVLDNFEQILPAAPLVAWMATIARASRYHRAFMLGSAGTPQQRYTWSTDDRAGEGS